MNRADKIRFILNHDQMKKGKQWFTPTIMHITELPVYGKCVSSFQSLMTIQWSYLLYKSCRAREIVCDWNLIIISVRAELTHSSQYLKRSNAISVTPADNNSMFYPRLQVFNEAMCNALEIVVCPFVLFFNIGLCLSFSKL